MLFVSSFSQVGSLMPVLARQASPEVSTSAGERMTVCHTRWIAKGDSGDVGNSI